MEVPYVDIRCLTCEKIKVICSSCFRGQRYCSPVCRHLGYKRNAKLRAKRNRTSPLAKLATRIRQKRHRIAKSRGHVPKKNVTHATSISSVNSTNSSLGWCRLKCSLCGRPVTINMQGSRHPATEFRRKCDLRGAKVRNQKTLYGRKMATWYHRRPVRDPPADSG